MMIIFHYVDFFIAGLKLAHQKRGFRRVYLWIFGSGDFFGRAC